MQDVEGRGTGVPHLLSLQAGLAIISGKFHITLTVTREGIIFIFLTRAIAGTDIRVENIETVAQDNKLTGVPPITR